METSAGAIGMDENGTKYYIREDNGEDLVLYSCPLGYIQSEIGEMTTQALVDTGSMINILPEHEGYRLGLKIRKISATLSGIGGHQSEIVGVAEFVPVTIGETTKSLHFFLVSGPVKVVFGRPFLAEFGTTLEFSESKGELLSFLDEDNRRTWYPISKPGVKWQKTIPDHVFSNTARIKNNHQPELFTSQNFLE